jgi:multiple sugar transport system ATP-binding protein
MNMLTGRIDATDSARFVTGDGVALPVGRPLAGAPNGPVVYGLRPESMHLGGEVPLRVDVVEPTGSETHVLGRFGATEVVGVFRERVRAQPGEEIRVSIDPQATHLFDAASGARISA